MKLLQGLRANFLLHGADRVTASRKALGAIYGMVQQHAAMLAFVEAFWIMGVIFLLMLPFLPLLQYSKLKAAASVASEGEKATLAPINIGEAIEEPVTEEEDHRLVFH